MVINIEYLDRDLDWFGIDKNGCIAHFANGSVGPIPKYLEQNLHILEKHLNFFLSLKCISKAVLLENPKWDWSSFTCMAERGLYSYDFKLYEGPYYLIAKPLTPLLITEISDEIQKELKEICFDKVCFNDLAEFNPTNFIKCVP